MNKEILDQLKTRQVKLEVSGEAARTFTTAAQITTYFNSTGRIEYNAAAKKFIIHEDKFPAGSSIKLTYYYKK